MFFHHFKYSFKTLFRDRMLIFWTFAFPIILGTFFSLAFSDIEKSESFSLIDIAILDNEEFRNQEYFKQSFAVLGDENSDQQIFRIQYVETEDDAKFLLQDKKIVGYLHFSSEPVVSVATNGINETIFKYVVSQIHTNAKMVSYLVEEQLSSIDLSSFDMNQIERICANISQTVLETMARDSSIVDVSSSKLSYTMIEFYTLIAMTCLYGGILGMVSVNHILANMSSNGKRISVSPASKGKLLFGSVLSSYLIQLIGIVLLFLYTIFVLHVDYGTHFFSVVLLTLLGCFAGLSFGVMVATMMKTSENTKTGVLIAITMFGCFLSGMMGITMKYLVDKHVFFLNLINPLHMITDGFYSLYYYETFDRFYFNVIRLVVFSLVMVGVSFIGLRRQKYDRI